MDGDGPVLQGRHQGAGGEEPGDEGGPGAAGPTQGGSLQEQEEVWEDHS